MRRAGGRSKVEEPQGRPLAVRGRCAGVATFGHLLRRRTALLAVPRAVTNKSRLQQRPAMLLARNEGTKSMKQPALNAVTLSCTIAGVSASQH